jgi:SprT protein
MKALITVPNELIAKVEDKVLETFIKAEAIWQRQLELPRLQFDLRGTCAGRAYYRDYQIRLNPVLLFENQTDFIEQTVPHEVAHLLTSTLHTGPARVMPHGPEWKSVMLALGLKPVRCHSYDTSNAQVRRERRFTYACACGIVVESARSHFKLQCGEIRSVCRRCCTYFKFLNEGEVVSPNPVFAPARSAEIPIPSANPNP